MFAKYTSHNFPVRDTERWKISEFITRVARIFLLKIEEDSDDPIFWKGRFGNNNVG